LVSNSLHLFNHGITILTYALDENDLFPMTKILPFSTFISLIFYRFLETSVKKWNLSFHLSTICDFWKIINANANYKLVINYKFGNLKLLDFQAWNGFLELLTIDNFEFVKFSIPSIVVFIFAYFWKIRVLGNFRMILQADFARSFLF